MSETITSESQVQIFWDFQHEKSKLEEINVDEFIVRGISPYGRNLLHDILGDFNQKEVLDLGCGDGSLSVYMAKKGAKVTSVDISKKSIEFTKALARMHEVSDSVEAYQIDALNLGELDKKFDLVVGKFILHHIEPFEDFCLVLDSTLKDNGRGVFIENSSRNLLFKLARLFTGKFGIPKFGDDEEYPFEPREVELLKKNVGSVTLQYPDFVFFRMLNTYIFRHNAKFKAILEALVSIDDFIYFYFPFFNKYSYMQIVEISSKSKANS